MELLPVMHYDGESALGWGPDNKPMRNYWGYGTIAFFAPHPDYCLSPEEGSHLDDFRGMVKALHRAGIEVILTFNCNHPAVEKIILEFFKRMIAFRKAHRSPQRGRFFDGAINERGLKDIAWRGCAMESPGWDDPEGRALAFTLAGFDGEDDLHVMMNMHWEPLYFELPRVPGREWRRAIATSLPGC